MLSAIIIYLVVFLYNYTPLNLNHALLLPPLGPLLTIGAMYVYQERSIKSIDKRLIYLSKRYGEILLQEKQLRDFKSLNGLSSCSFSNGWYYGVWHS